MNPTDRAVAELAAQWFPLAVRTARACARRWRLPRMSDEFVSAAGEAILQGVRAFLNREGDPDRPPIPAFVRRAVAWECYRVRQAERVALSLDAARGTDRETLLALLTSAEPDAPANAARAEEAARAAALLERAGLTDGERDVAVRYYGDGSHLRELATALGCSHQNVYRLAASALLKLRAAAGVESATTRVKQAATAAAEARRMHAAGVPIADIARELKVSYVSVYNAVNRIRLNRL